MIRHYEAVGLMPAPARTDAGYRQYDEADVHTLGFIRRARDLGFAIHEIAELVDLWQNRKRASRVVKRLARIEGQVRGLHRMVEEDRYCADILTQISSVHEALRAVGRELMRNHLKHCASSAIRSGDGDAESMYDELIEMMYKHSR